MSQENNSIFKGLTVYDFWIKCFIYTFNAVGLDRLFVQYFQFF